MTSFLARILRIKPKEKTLSTQEAIEKLLQTECLLRKRADIIVAKIDEEISNAKKYGTKNKRLALKALRTKKIYAQQLQNLDATLLSLEYQRETLENANSNIEVYRVVGMATQAIKTINDRIDVDTINDWNERVAEQRFLENEMKHTFIDATAKTNVTEDELIKELEDLEQEQLERELLDTRVQKAGPYTFADGEECNGECSINENELNTLIKWAKSN